MKSDAAIQSDDDALDDARPDDLDEPLPLRSLLAFLLATYRIPVSAESIRRYRVDGLGGKRLECYRFAGRVYYTRRAALEFFGPPPSRPDSALTSETDITLTDE